MSEEKGISFLKIYNVVTMDENTFEIVDKNSIELENRDCEIIEFTDDKNFKIKAYKYTDTTSDTPQVKIGVYATNFDGYLDKHIYEDLWYIKLTIKHDDVHDYIYINFIRNFDNSTRSLVINNLRTADNYVDYESYAENISREKYQLYNSENILKIIKKIALACGIHKIVLQDDAMFSCANDLQYGIKAIQLRSLYHGIDISENWWNIGPKNKLSIYQKSGFIPTNYKKTQISGCISAIQKINCSILKRSAIGLKNILSRIGEKDENYSIRRMLIKEGRSDLNITYTTVNSINYPSICQQYIRNLDSLLEILSECKNPELSIYDFYQTLCEKDKLVQETPDCCTKRGKLLSCLKNSSNSYVITINGIRKQTDIQNTCCDAEDDLEKDGNLFSLPMRRAISVIQNVKELPLKLTRSVSDKPVQTKKPTKGPIIITKLFNLFNGTFEKLKYIYFKMECKVSETDDLKITPS